MTPNTARRGRRREVAGLRSGRRATTLRPALMVLVVTATLVGLAPGSAAAAAYDYRSTPTNPWWVNGRVYATRIVGTRLIVGGAFSAMVDGAGRRISRANLAAFDLATGQPDTGFRADTNGEVRAIEWASGRLFAAGAFTSVAGVARGRLAELNPSTGDVGSFRVGASGTVFALRADGARLYVGGAFGSLGGQTRARLGAVDLGSNSVIAGFSPSFDNHVRSITTAASGSRVFVGGQFTMVNGVARRSLVQLDTNGAPAGPRFPVSDMVWGVDASPDGATVYAAVGGVGGSTTLSNSAVAFSGASGAVRWKVTTDGDVQAVALLGPTLWFGFHDGFRGDTTVHLLGADAATGALRPWRSPMSGFWGVWHVTGDADRLIAGGEFRATGRANLAVFPA